MTTKNKYYDIFENKAGKTAEVLIYGVIGDSWWEESITARQFISEFRNLEKDHDRINIRINSPGGSVWDGQAIFNAILSSKAEIHTYNDGLCASMAAVLLLVAKPENVHPAKNSLLMLHSPITGAYGNRKDIEKVLDVLDKVQSSLITSVCEKTGLEKEAVESKYFDYEDHWFTAEEAKAEGLYQNIDEYEAENVPQNASTLKFTDLVKQFEPSDTIFSNWIGRIAPQSAVVPETNDTLIFTDMDLQKIRDVFNLTEEKYPTEDSVLAFMRNHVAEHANLQQAKTKAETDLATANQTIAAKEAEIVALGGQPGAQPASAASDTDPGAVTEDEPAKDFMTAFATCMNVIKPQKSK